MGIEKKTIIAAAFAVGVILSLSRPAYAGNDFGIGLSHLALHSGERIVGFRIRASGAGIAALRSIPMGWTITIDNDASWVTSVSGTVEVGAAALDPAAFRAFMVVRRADPTLKLPMELSGEIIVMDLATGSPERHITLKPRQFEIDRIP